MSREKGNISLLMDRAMSALAKYGFLTVNQMQRLGVAKNIGNIRPEVKMLMEWKYIGVVKYAETDLVKHPYWYFLTPKGASVFADRSRDDIEIRHPKSLHDIAKRDYLHRVNFIDTWISYDEWIIRSGLVPVFFHAYFDFLGSNRNQDISGVSRSKNRIILSDGTPIVPDGVFLYRNGEKEKLFLLEVSRGDDTKKIVQKIEKICQSMKEGATAIHFGKQIPERGLFTFEDEGTMKSTINRVFNDPAIYKKGLENYLFFAMAGDVQRDFSQWIKLTSEKINLNEI